jgi:two-component system LytT family response regulator
MERIKSIGSKEENKGIHQIIKHDKGLDKLIVKNKEGISFINMNDIVMIQRENRSTVIYSFNESYTTSESLGDLEEKLDKTQFFRSHKSYIINLSIVDKIYPYGRWTYIVKLKNTDKDALLTHDKYTELEKIFLS